MADIDMARLRMLYGSLTGMREALSLTNEFFYKELGDDYSAAVRDLAILLSQDLSRFQLPEGIYDKYSYEPLLQARKSFLEGKLIPLISFLECGYHLNEEVVEVGTLYGSLEDEELRGRCADILSARNNFDRVVNQATMVLEDRIRRKARDSSGLTGTSLVNNYVKAKPEESKIVISSDPEEQEGFSNVLRGMMLAFRNTTHHSPSDIWTREDALKVCEFVDYLLKRLEGATVSGR
ncbi:MAG TPA: TIGR02391 family protein [Candidatus Deferrimicrobium sp.]|nr:TIGR02391 family protein [Candidatus Deferrimicrobium sp.]